MWSLGNRGLGIGALLLIPVLARTMKETRPRARHSLLAVALACSLWSYALMVQGHTNFVRWADLLAAQAATASRLAPLLPLALSVSLAAYWLARGRDRGERVLLAGTALLVGLILDYLAGTVADAVAGSVEGWWVPALRLCFITLAPIAAVSGLPPAASRAAVGATARPLLAIALLALFATVGGLFLRLGIEAEGRIAAGGVPGSGPVGSVQLPEVEECYREYLRVPGFEDKKDALRRFLERSTRE
jgi:hypothetical protein